MGDVLRHGPQAGGMDVDDNALGVEGDKGVDGTVEVQSGGPDGLGNGKLERSVDNAKVAKKQNLGGGPDASVTATP